MLNKAACLFLGNNLVSQVFTITVGRDPEDTFADYTGFTSVEGYNGPWGSLTPHTFLDTGINRLMTYTDGKIGGEYYVTWLGFYSYGRPTTNTIRLTRLDTGLSILLPPYYGDAYGGYRNENSRFFKPADVGKTFQIQLTELKE